MSIFQEISKVTKVFSSVEKTMSLGFNPISNFATALGLTTAAKPVSAAIKSLSPVQKLVATTAAVTTAPAVATVALKNPEKIVDAPSKVLTNYVEFQSDLANLADNPSLDNLKKLGKGSPVILGALGAVGLVSLGKTAVPIAQTIASTRLTSQLNSQNEELNKGLEDWLKAKKNIVTTPTISDMPTNKDSKKDKNVVLDPSNVPATVPNNPNSALPTDTTGRNYTTKVSTNGKRNRSRKRRMLHMQRKQVWNINIGQVGTRNRVNMRSLFN